MRVMRYWARNLKARVFKAIKDNIAYRMYQRELGFKGQIHEQERLVKIGFRGFLKNTFMQKMEKSMNIKALRFFSRRYKKLGFKCLLISKIIVQNKRQKGFEANLLKFGIEQRYLKDIIDQWRDVKSGSIMKAQQLGHILQKVCYTQRGFDNLVLSDNKYKLIEQKLQKRRLLNLLKRNVKLQNSNRYFMMICASQYQKYLKFQALKSFRIYHKQIKENGQFLIDKLERYQISISFRKLDSYGLRIELLNQVLTRIQQQKKAKAFRRFLLNSKLQVLSDALISKIRVFQRFIHWKDIVFYDKRIVKLMARAAKHRNRVLKKQYFNKLRLLIYPKLFVLPHHRKNLLRESFKKLNVYKIKKRIVNYKVQKIQKQHFIIMKQQYLNKWYLLSNKIVLEKQQEQEFEEKVRGFRRSKLFLKGMRSLQIQAFRRRVFNYLQKQRYLQLGARMVQKMRNGIISNRAKVMKKQVGSRHYNQNLYVKVFNMLRMNQQLSLMTKFKNQKAYRLYLTNLAKKSLYTLYRQAYSGKVKRVMINDAIQDRLSSVIRNTFLKLLKVGIYWATIKNRFGIQQRSGRIYLGLKYGMRWRAKALIVKYSRITGQNRQNFKQIKIENMNRGTTEVVKQQLILAIQNKRAVKPPMPFHTRQQLPNQAFNNNQTFTNQNLNNTQTFNPNKSLTRIKEIEQEILNFKNKKLLLKELEDQYKLMEGNPQLQNLMKQKYNTLRNELVELQPKVKVLLQEITLIKSQQQQLSQTAQINMSLVNQSFVSNNDPSFMLSKSMISNFN